MEELRVEVEGGDRVFRPGERIRAEVSWQLEQPPEELETRLFWYTEGKGDLDVEVVATVDLPAGDPSGRQVVEFDAPRGPLSFSGQLVSLIWAIELVALPSALTGRQEIVISHTGREIDIRSDPPEVVSP